MAEKRDMTVKVKMPEQLPEERIKNFKEVTLGYGEKEAKEEAARCLNCKAAQCVSGCPVNVQIPQFIKLIAEEKYLEAAEKIKETNSLPAICGRVCPQESQCEMHCIRGKKGESVAIGRLERFVADYAIEHEGKKQKNFPKNGKKVAAIGSGPASLACAGDLAKAGFDVTIFEAFHIPGGVLVYGIPEFRLPKALVRREIEMIREMGVKIMTNMVIGKVLSLEDLYEEGFEAVFIGTGAGLPSMMGLPGENLNGVYYSNEFLTRINLMKAYDFPNVDTPVYVGNTCAVIGGGNVAMDAARSARRLGAKKVYIVYRRSMDELPARAEEVHHAMEEGVEFMLLTNPTEIIGDERGWVKEVKFNKMELGEPDKSGRRRPVEIKDSEFILPVDTLVIAIGQTPNPIIKDAAPELEYYEWGGIKADEETGRTNKMGVYAGGDIITGAATVILAMGAGKRAAKSIMEYLSQKTDESG